MELWASIKKEWLVLIRDKGGMAILFLMPVALVVIMAVVQDAPFRDYQERKLEVLVLNQDNGTVAEAIISGLDGQDNLTAIDSLDGQPLDEKTLNASINEGDHQLGIILKEGLSEELEEIISVTVDNLLAGVMPGQSTAKQEIPDLEPYITLVLDPTTKSTFRTTINSNIKQFLSELEAKMIVDGLTTQLAEMTGAESDVDLSSNGIVQVRENIASGGSVSPDVASNSTQHNVPAWTVFAMFLIVIPLSGSMVRERAAGTIVRLRTMPTSMTNFYAGKLLTYSAVSLAQAMLMVAVGLWFLPLLGLAQLDLGSGFLPLIFVAFSVGMAATAYGLLAGTFFETHQQSAIFGIVSVVIMAALGGIWVPLYIMSDSLQMLGTTMPLNWAMEAFNSVLLRGNGMGDVMQDSLPLWGLTLVCFALALTYEKVKNR